MIPEMPQVKISMRVSFIGQLNRSRVYTIGHTIIIERKIYQIDIYLLFS